jgi:hypothetical protein
MVRTTTLNTLFVTHGVPDLLKVDIEGYERTVLETLDRSVPALCFEWAEEGVLDIVAIVMHLAKLGFQSFALQDGDAYLVCPPFHEFQRPSEFVIDVVRQLVMCQLFPSRKTRWGMVWALPRAPCLWMTRLLSATHGNIASQHPLVDIAHIITQQTPRNLDTFVMAPTTHAPPDFFGDPAPGVFKQLRLECVDENGVTQTAVLGEANSQWTGRLEVGRCWE